MHAHLSDQALVEALNHGSEDAYREIYDRYWRSLYLVAKNRLSSQHEAEELVQNVFLNLWNRRENFSLQRSLNSYFSVAIKYEIINFIARKHKERNYKASLSIEKPMGDLSTEDQIRYNEVRRRITETIVLLPERSQLVFHLRFEQGFSQKDIARQLNVSEKTVEAHISKLRKHIRAGLDPLSLFLVSSLCLHWML